MKTNILEDVVDETDEIALEGLLLDKVCAEYFAALETLCKPSKGLIAALEDNSLVATEQDSGTIKKLVEYIYKFIERIINNIRTLFSNDNKKENTDFVKTYKGPTDADYVKAIRHYVQDAARKDETVAEKLKTIPALSHNPSVVEAEKQLRQATGEQLTIAELFKRTKLANINSRLGVQTSATLNCMLDKTFSDNFQKALGLVDTIVNKRVYNDNLEEHFKVFNEVSQICSWCNENISENDSRQDNVEAWVLGTDRKIATLALEYIDIDVTVLYLNQYLKNFNVLIKQLSSEESDGSVALLKTAQDTLNRLTAFLSLAARVNKAYNSGIAALRGM